MGGFQINEVINDEDYTLELPKQRIDTGLMIPDDQEELENAHDQGLEHISDNFQDALEPGEHLL